MKDLVGILPNQVPTNGDLGTMAFQDISNFESNIPYILYDNRATLRHMGTTTNTLCMVESLGMFRFTIGATVELDDDETCFVADGGVWLLEYPHWDFVDANMIPMFNELEMRIEDVIGLG